MSGSSVDNTMLNTFRNIPTIIVFQKRKCYSIKLGNNSGPK